jgi:hypothetical protein
LQGSSHIDQSTPLRQRSLTTCRRAILAAMRRPLIILVIACYFFVSGIYLCSIAVIMLLIPSAIETISHAPYVSGLRFVTPYLSLLVGVLWVLAAWGLFRLRNWARWLTMLMLGSGSAWAAVTMLTANVPFGWRVVFNWMEIGNRGGSRSLFGSVSQNHWGIHRTRGQVNLRLVGDGGHGWLRSRRIYGFPRLRHFVLIYP